MRRTFTRSGRAAAFVLVAAAALVLGLVLVLRGDVATEGPGLPTRHPTDGRPDVAAVETQGLAAVDSAEVAGGARGQSGLDGAASERVSIGERTLTVVVRDAATHEPLMAAEILAFDERFDAAYPFQSAPAGPDGTVTCRLELDLDAEALPAVPARVTAPGHAAAIVANLLEHDGGEVLLHAGATLVVCAPAVPPGLEAQVRLVRGAQSGTRRPVGSAPVRLDAPARFVDLPPGLYSVGVTDAGKWAGARLGIELRAGEERQIVLEPDPLVTVRGHVVDVEGEDPLPGVGVRLLPRSSGVFGAFRRAALPVLETDERGAFAFDDVPIGRADVELRLVDGSRQRREIVVTENQDARTITLRARGSAVLEGKLSSALLAGTEPSDWRVLVAPRGSVEPALAAAARAGIRPPRADGGADVSTPRPGRDGWEVAGDGTFVVRDAPSGRRLALFAVGPVARVGRAEIDEPLGVGERREGLVIEAVDGLEFPLHVLTASGAPLTEVAVAVEERFAGQRTFGPNRALESSTGRYRIRSNTEDPFRVRVRVEGYASALAVIQRDAPTVVHLRERRSVEIWVVDEAGLAVRGAEVVATADTGTVDERGKPRLLRRTRRSGFLGRAELELDPAHTWSVTARASGHRPPKAPAVVPRLAPDGERFVLELPYEAPPEPARILGTLVRAGSGNPLYDVRFTGLRGATATLDGKEFRIEGVAPGPVRMRVECGGFETLTLPVTEIRPGETVEVGELRTRPASRVEVVVVDSKGETVPNAKVDLRNYRPFGDGDAKAPGRLGLRQVRGRRGRHARDAVVRGRWTVVVRHPELGRATRNVRVDEARERFRVTLGKD